MSDEELVMLIKTGIDVRDNMEQLYKQCYGYIKWVAKKYIDYVDIEDLMQEGYIALNNAVYDYDVSLGKFTVWLYTHLMRQYGKVFLRSDSHGGFNKHYNSQVLRYLKLRGRFMTLFGREPMIEEYVAYLRLPIEAINRIKHMVSIRNAISMDSPIEDDEGDNTLTLGNSLPNSNDTEGEVVAKLMEDDLKLGLWELVKDAVNDDEYSVVRAVYQFNMPLDKYAAQNDISRQVATNSFYSGLGKLRSPKIRNQISDRFEINNAKVFKAGLSHFRNTCTSSTEDVAIKNIEIELNYISYVLTAAFEGYELLTDKQIKLALEHRLIDEDGQVYAKWEIPKRGIAGEKMDQYDKTGKLIKRWENADDASKTTGITLNDIRRCAKGTRATAGGFIWRKVSQEVVNV